MKKTDFIEGFSKLGYEEKVKLVAELLGDEKESFLKTIGSHLHIDKEIQSRYAEFSENTLSNFFLPYSIAPNFLINDKVYHVPMVVEESSVVAAASAAAKFWSTRGGFQCEITQTRKTGQVHFTLAVDATKLQTFFADHKSLLFEALRPLTANMEKRGGGITDIALRSPQGIIKNYHQLSLSFETVDSMGANFINSCLEKVAEVWERLLSENHLWFEGKGQIIMSILSNYTPECTVKCSVSAPVSSLSRKDQNLDGEEFAEKFVLAVAIAKDDVYRAVTHNKGIFNGIDAVVIATGNDFRAVEAGAHAFASRNGQYNSLSDAWVDSGNFTFQMEIPLSIGTVGGLTGLHPMASNSLKLLGNPSAKELMMVVASAGLANNFSAVRSLVTSGIQKGHMKLHLSNLLNQFQASGAEKQKALDYFDLQTVSYRAVQEFLSNLRKDS